MEDKMVWNENGYQNVIVMRHGDRMDNYVPQWMSTAEKPWDPPLMPNGTVEAFRMGQRFRSQLGFPIHRIFISPLLRCVQTAAEVAVAISAIDVDPKALSSKDITSINHSKLKVAIELGLCETLKKMAVNGEVKVGPKDGIYDFKISELEAMFPDGMVDHNAHRFFKEVPPWEESFENTRERMLKVVKTLADKYPYENLLFVAHGETVRTLLSEHYKDPAKCKIDYCGYVKLKRKVSCGEAGDFEEITSLDEAGYLSLRPLN